MYKYQINDGETIFLQCRNYTMFIQQCRKLLIRKSHLPNETIYKLEHCYLFEYIEDVLGYDITFMEDL